MAKKEPQWKRHALTLDIDGIHVEAVIVYWAKDYYIEIKKPMIGRISGLHMLHMIPAIFVIEEENEPTHNYGQVPILEECKEKIIKFVHDNYEGPSYDTDF